MMKKLIAAGAALAMMAAPLAAAAQDAVILFIDQSKLIATSKAGQSIGSQVKALAEAAEAEVAAFGQSVQDEGKKLEESKDSLSKEDFGKRYQALLARAQEVSQLGQIKKAEIGQSEARALAQLNEQLEPIVNDIVKKRKATVLLQRRSVVFADEKMDITDEIIKALDKKVKTIKVEKVDLVAQAQAAQAQRANR